MIFSSLVFMIYFLPIALIGFYGLSFSKRTQEIWMLFISLFFYAWGNPWYALGMFFLVGFNYMFGLLAGRGSKFWLLSGLGVNTAVIFLFKYWEFFAQVIKEMYHISLPVIENLELPVGLAFFYLRAAAYLIDVYKARYQAGKNPLQVGLYFCFFPQVINGPFISYREFTRQLGHRENQKRRLSVGACRFTVGLAKKVLIADSLAVISDNVFNLSTIGADLYTVPAALAWLGAVSITLRIYLDFSAYSDMAVGLGLMFGFKFSENVDYPFTAVTIKDFWRRWNLSLWKWGQRYIYEPLSQRSKKSRDAMVKNSLVLWLVIGMFYGAGWTFLLWALWNFLLITAEEFGHFESLLIPLWVRRLIICMSVVLGMVLFASKDLYQAGMYYKNMFGRCGFFSDTADMFVREYGIVLAAAGVLCTPLARTCNQLFLEQPKRWFARMANGLYPIGLVLLLFISLAYMAVLPQTQFWFYRF